MDDKLINLEEIPLIKLEYPAEKKRSAVKSIAVSMELFLVAALMFFELVFHFVRFGATGDNLPYKLLFSLFYGILFGTLISLLPDVAARIGTIFLTAFFMVYFMIQIIYSGVFNTYLSVAGSIGMTGQAFDFTDVIMSEILHEWWVLLLFLLPLAFLIVFWRKRMVVRRRGLVRYGLQTAALFVIFIITLTAMNGDGSRVYSAYEVYSHYISVDMSVEKLGVCEALWLDVKAGMKEAFGVEGYDVTFMAETGMEEQSAQDSGSGTADGEEGGFGEMAGIGSALTVNDTVPVFAETIIDTSPNVLDIDFDELIAGEPDSSIVGLHTYIQSVTPTNKNEYTGMFEGYNLIFVVAEGFSGYVIDEEITPTLYRMSREGFCFKNYYTPLWYGSTLGGEYADLTGLMPKNGSYLSMAKAGRNGNDMMFTLSTQLKNRGYQVRGFHNNDYTYYDRQISHTNLGYDWVGVGNGFEPERDSYGTQLWPQSDLRLIEETFDIYKSEEPFHTYYLTVSGHVMYNFDGNAMAKRHKDMVENLDYSETTKAYIACQYELELAMEELVRSLEEEGLADNTLIVLTADHVPYDNKDVVDELAGQELDNTFEWYKNTLIIWSASMKEPVKVNKYCSSIDILPTVSNLMGLPYDSRMLAGQDILSDSEGLVMFNDRSFITEKCSYNANTGEIRSIDGSPIDETYVDNKIVQVRNKFSMAEAICDYDYYRYIEEALKGKASEND